MLSSAANRPTETEYPGRDHAERAGAWRCGVGDAGASGFYRSPSRNRAASCACITATARPACRSTRRRPIRSTSRSCRSSTTSSSTTSTRRRTASTTIVPELAESWAWSDDGKTLTFKLRQGVKWHDGKPFTAADVKCTFDMLLGKSQQKFRHNPRKAWYPMSTRSPTNGDYEASFHLKRPQPALLALLASGYSPVYPCHVSPARHAHHPIGTGPFKFVEFKPNESIKLDQEPGLLEEGPALSRRHRVHDHPEPLDRDPRLRRRQVRHDLPDRGDDPAAEGREDRRRRTRSARSSRPTSPPT